MADETITAIERCVTRFLDEVPALKPMKLVDANRPLPPTVRKVADWREAFVYGQAKASGPTQILQLVSRGVDKQEERDRLQRAKRQH